MSKGFLLSLVVVLAIGCGVLGGLLLSGDDDPEDSSSAAVEDAVEDAATGRVLSTGQVEQEFSTALQNSGEIGPYDVATASCTEADESNREFDCSVDFIGAAASGTYGEFDPAPGGSVPPQGVTYRVSYDEAGHNLTWARSAGGTSTPPAAPSTQSGTPAESEAAPDTEAVAAAEEYAASELEVSPTGETKILLSPMDDAWALASGVSDETGWVVWLQSSDDGWQAVGGTTDPDAEAPSEIPCDIAVPFTEVGAGC